jgi:hypothetical protein
MGGITHLLTKSVSLQELSRVANETCLSTHDTSLKMTQCNTKCNITMPKCDTKCNAKTPPCYAKISQSDGATSKVPCHPSDETKS